MLPTNDQDDLSLKHCTPCHGDTPPLDGSETESLLGYLENEWQLLQDSNTLTREFRFKNYYQTIAFVNAVAWIAHAEDHHPDLEVGYNRCRVSYTTHAIGGLSENDFICARKVDALVGRHH